MTEIQKKLFEYEDKEYKEFHSKLIPNIPPEKIIGVRTPELRKLAGQLSKEQDIQNFLDSLPHRYYEENNLHGFIIEKIKDFDQCINEIKKFIPYVDNWATCDFVTPKIFKNNTDKLILEIKEWISSGSTYTVRFAVKMLMNFYLDDCFSKEYPQMVADIISEEYYVNMMRAWYFATALAKQYDAVIPYIEQNRLDKWTHNKTIQKSIESFRITSEQKQYLRTMKVK